MKNYKKISIQNFIDCFGAKRNEFNKNILKYIKNNNFEYIETSKTEREKIFKDIFEKINKKQFSRSGKKRFLDWEDGWKQNYINFKKSNYNTEELIPKYIHGDRPIRWNQKFIISKKPLLEWRFSNVFRNWIFKKYFNNVKNIYDYGTGTGCHLVLMSKIFPRKKLVGLDWSKYSQKIIKLLNNKKKLNIKCYNFDFFNINNKIKIESNSGVLTYGALEQVGGNFKNFINYLIKNKPEICVHVECEDSFYNKNKYIDYLGYRYHMQRGYLTGFINFLKYLEKKKVIRILNIKRLYFGSYYQEVYNYIVWKIVK